MSSAPSAQRFITKLMASPQNRTLAMEADRIRGLLSFARQLQPGDPKHAEYRGMIGHILFVRVVTILPTATMFDPIFLSAVVEITSLCKNSQWVGLPNWQNIREDDPRIEKHSLIHKTWYVHPKQQMLHVRQEGGLPVADPPAATAGTVSPLANNASVASGTAGNRRLHVFGPKSQAHAKENVMDVPTDVSRGRSNHRGSKKRGISESESRTPLARGMGGGSRKRICADVTSNTVNKMREGVPKGVIFVQHPGAKTKTPASASKAADSASPLADPSGAVSTVDPCPRCAREGRTCIRATGKTGLLLVCTECKRSKVKCELDVNQPTRQGKKSGVRGKPHSRSVQRARTRSTSSRHQSPSKCRTSTLAMQRKPSRVVMSYVSVPRLPISAPESTAVKLRSMERKMSGLEDVIDLLHREMETLRTMIDA
ncbi:hypothetical protein DEU56DRAFT_332026 [Suillus clintonianus]|uniref:uncharacterized protein n=1 Tax=Suillus clintonianus TaxID=1904413 RepID=UPI001B86DF68|nr:uncharacterized protein DEU56DRAFT_332026 [Suillus clintonianus]KAG2139027.1 hypothetical protein DEU56DRAFT_332026 [Suillus clintonianus]